MPTKFSNLNELLRWRAENNSGQLALTFLRDGEKDEVSWTYEELARRAWSIAALVQSCGSTQHPVLLLYPPGPDFIAAFWGCLATGAIAVPVYPPHSNRTLPRLKAVIQDSQARTVLTTKSMHVRIKSFAESDPQLASLRYLVTDDLNPAHVNDWKQPRVTGESIAFLQYTSGSTAKPKGVMISHSNLLENEAVIQEAFRQTEKSVIVGWLPLYHDMGLIGNMLQPIYVGARCILMPPMAFLEHPFRWLQAITRYRATTSGGPNFSYDLCVRKISEYEFCRLDLSSWEVAFNGAEPVRSGTLQRFAEKFGPAGFNPRAFTPCYGLAEATLLVAGHASDSTPSSLELDAQALTHHQVCFPSDQPSAVQAVSCGHPAPETSLLIVDPESLLPASPNRVGEIWISGPGVARGYWNQPDETKRVFQAKTEGNAEGRYLRTGDLGFLRDRELFVTGRLKDLIIIRGRNYYPHDIEETSGGAHPALRPGCGVAFSVESNGEEQLVVVQEAASRSRDELNEAIQLIVRRITEVHELNAHAIVLVRTGTIPKTSSGKLQRHICKTDFLNDNLHVLKKWDESSESQADTTAFAPSLEPYQPGPVATWLIAELARITGAKPVEIDVHEPLMSYGLNSLAVVNLCHKIQVQFCIEIASSDLFDGLSIADIEQRATSTRLLTNGRRAGQPSTFPLSYGQKAIWFLYQMAPQSAAYNISRAMRIVSTLEVEALRRALQSLVDRHAALRTIFTEVAGEPVQQVLDRSEVSFEYLDASHWNEAELQRVLTRQSHLPFSLTQGPLFRASLYARSEDDHVLHVAIHHIIADYWSLALLLEELGSLYMAHHNKGEVQLAPIEGSYADFVEWQNEKLSSPEGERLRLYWKEDLSGELTPLSLPADHGRPPVQTFRGSSFPFTVDAQLTKELKRLAMEQKATLFTTLLAAFQVLLYRITSQTQVIVGCPVAGRVQAEFANTVGYFVNALPLRAELQHRQAFAEFLSQVRSRVSKALAHDIYPFPLMVEQLGSARDPAVPPIFQSMFVFQQTYGSQSQDFLRFALGQQHAQLRLGGLSLEHVAVGQETSQFDLTLTLGDGPDGIIGSWEYSSDLFDDATVARWAESFSLLLKGIVENPEMPLGQLPMLSSGELGRLVQELNQTELEYDQEQCLHELIAEQAKSRPGGIAIVYGMEELNYAELNKRANQVARRLLRLGVKKEDFVAVCMRRSPEMVAAMLGVWKAKSAYVPLDPEYPEERMRFMLEDANARVVITEESLRRRVIGTTAAILCLDREKEEIDQESTEDVGGATCSRQVAYLIYTSGSSGVPKGVMLTHQNAMSFVTWVKRTFSEQELSGVLASTSICFDLSIFELWATLSCGGTVVLADNVLGWWESLRDRRVSNRVRLLNTVPSAITKLIEQGPLPQEVITINLAGEALKEELVNELWQAGNLKHINNLYGPTETTTYSAWTPVDPQKKVTIGRGIGNTRLYVMDERLELVPFGVVGVLFIAGAGVGDGYWRRADLTAERFLPDPYSQTPGDRMYGTGDLVRWNNAGQLEYLGRADQQVKVRGYRIELGEIEAILSGHPAVRENAVVIRESGAERWIGAYVAAKPGMEIKEEEIRHHLQEHLPRYMVPAQFVVLDSLPKTPNGKIDRKALPEPVCVGVKGRRAQTETEQMIATIWADVIRVDEIGAEENFFDLGGHSLIATQIISRIRQTFAVELPLRTLLENPTVAGLAIQVDRAGRTEAPPLQRASREQPPRLSFSQERLWFLSSYETEASLYNVPVALRLQGPLNKVALHSALQEIVARHEVLRTSFQEIDGVAIQNIASAADFLMPVHDIDEMEMPEFLRQQARLPFDLASGPVFRASLLQLGTQDHVLLVVLHHIVCDGWSLGIMLRELTELYDACDGGTASPLAPLTIQYADFAAWQREWLRGEPLQKHTEYWKTQLAGVEPLNLPTDRQYPASRTFAGASYVTVLPGTLARQLRLLSRQQGATLFMTLLTAFKILLRRYTSQEDIAVGTPIANRMVPGVEQLIGFFVNTLVLRTSLAADTSVAEFLGHVREVSLQAYAHQDIPFEKLVEILDPVRDLSRTPLFQTMFVLQNTPLPNVAWKGLKATPWMVEIGISKFDLTLAVREADDELELSLEYSTELFHAERMKHFLGHYRSVLEGMVVYLQKPANEIEILSKTEREQLVVDWNQTAAEYDQEKSLAELVEDQARKTPEALAVVSGNRELTYVELNRRANQIAHYLKRSGVRPEVRVGVCLERGWEMVVALIGVLKAGGAYVPLDGNYPEERLKYMIQDSAAALVVTQESLLEKLSGYSRLVVLDGEREELEGESEENPDRLTAPENLAYVIYTSGSTGRPKGVAIAHRSATVLLSWAREFFAPEDLKGVLASTSICFDLSVFEMFVPLTCGGTVFVVKDALELADMAGARRVNLINTVPSAMRELVRIKSVPESVRTVNLAGEALTWGLVQDIYNSTNIERICNLYGPSEDTTYSTYAWLSRNQDSPTVPIGRPIANTQAYVLDKSMSLLPVGVVGELHLSGAGLARGYLDRPELTAEKFVPNPFSTAPGTRMYRTGDLVCYRLDGSLDFLGRIDQQVKVRGYRIELPEIETVLKDIPGVTQAVVLALDHLGQKRLVAYVATKDGTPAVMKTALRKRVPEFMIPSDFVLLEQFPLTPNGKIDRRALLMLARPRGGEASPVELRTPAEELIAQIWIELLGVQQVAGEDNFFALGGHSLLATRMLSRLRQVFHREIGLRAVFQFPVLRELAAYVDSLSGRAQQDAILPAITRTQQIPLPLSSQQERLWFLDRYNSSGVAYNLPAAVRLKGDLNKEALRLSFQEILRRHEILRARFVQLGAKPQLEICEDARFELQETDLRDSICGAAAQEDVNRELTEEAARPFALTKGGLFRARLLQTGPQEHLLMVTVHHIVFDGWSVGVLASELSALYDAYTQGALSPLADLEIQYPDYAAWQRNMVETGSLTTGLNYWKEQLKGISVLELPADHARPAVQSFRGTTELWKVPPATHHALKALSCEHGTTLFMTLLAGFQILLARYSGQEDIAVGSPIANRAHPQLQSLIGFFVNTIVLRTNLGGNPNVEEALSQTRETCLAAFAHQAVPLEKLVDELEPYRDLSRNPLFQVAMVLQNAATATVHLPGLEISMLPPIATGAKFDLTLVVEEDGEGLHGFIEYSTDLFEQETIRQMFRHYNRVLHEMIRDPNRRISMLPLLAEDERCQLLYDWNCTAVVMPQTCIHELFEQQAQHTPTAQAVRCNGQSLTYAQLNTKATQLAHYLTQMGVGPEECVAICVERSLEMIVAILGVLKAGGAYVPLDPGLTTHNVTLLLEAAKPRMLLTQRVLSFHFPSFANRIVLLDEQWDEIARQSSRNSVQVLPDNLACVLYNATDGRPTGVAIQHSNAVAMLHWAQAAFGPEDLSAVLASTPVHLNESLFEMFAPLCSGGTVFVAKNAFDLTRTSEYAQVKLVQMPSSTMRELMRTRAVPESVRTINVWGEAASSGLAEKFYQRSKVERLFNYYAPSEYSSCSTHELLPRHRRNGSLAIGKPVMNTQTYVLDQEMEPVPVGVAGELYLAGAALSRGYMDQPDQTAGRFLPNPFSNTGGERLYRTGHMVRYRADGKLDFLGQYDGQIKIRGRQIEINQIEAALHQQAGVEDAVVVLRGAEKKLVAYIIPTATDGKAEGWEQKWRENLKAELKHTLPEYMVPSELLLLDKIPLRPDGRLDRDALPSIESVSTPSAQPQAPLGKTEGIIADIWKNILKAARVGVDESFFELGGNSLMIPEVHTALENALGVSLDIIELFQYPTIRSLAERLDAGRVPPEDNETAISDGAVKEEQLRSHTGQFAIVGMACRFPGAKTIEQFWNNLKGGIESIIDLSDEDLRAAGVDEELLASPLYIKRGAIVADVDLFDARFFDISAREAELIDPQQRLFLECAWEALENAGYTSQNYRGKIGVYAGTGPNTYLLNLLNDANSLYNKDAAAILFANGTDFMATRVSYKMNLTGPSLTLQTACSTSLVAVHMACRALLNNECDMAMAGGITLRNPQNIGEIFQEGSILSPDGHCRAFEERAQGTVRGNGGAIVVIKRLEDALRDGDHIHAVIRGSAINNDGNNKVSYTAPSIDGQRAVTRQALREAGVSAESISYVEAHGTSTLLGDPIEVSALTQAYRVDTDKTSFCALGSVKSNIGHADVGAGVAGLIKTVLALEHKVIPPTLHFERPNPKIDFEHSPFYVNNKAIQWQPGNGPRRAGVSSFGIGGTNAHVIVEEAPIDDSMSVSRPWQLLVLSAKTPTALETATANLEAYLEKSSLGSIANVAHTLQVGRTAFDHRRFAVAESVADAIQIMKARQTTPLPSSVISRGACRIAFLFPGQGAQYVNMGKHLYAHEPLFRELVDQCSELLRPSLQFDLRSVLYPLPEQYQWAETELRETRTTQPALFVIEYALARMWMSWGIQPDSMLGHSIGEYVAACLAGVLSLEDALNLVAIRGRLMHSCARGGMLAVAVSQEEVQRYLQPGLELAAINGSRSCVVTGPLESLELAEKKLAQEQVVHRRLQSSHAFHSAMMEPIVGQFTAQVQKIRLNAPRMRYLSNLTGNWITSEQATDPGYWGKQLRGTVQFAEGIRNLCDGGERLVLEVGPGHTNITAVRQTMAKAELPAMLTSLSDSHSGESDLKHVLTSLGQLWLRGATVDWNAFASGEKRKRIPLPTYPFERRRFWVDAPAFRHSHADNSRRKLNDWFYLPSWKETARIVSSSGSGLAESTPVLVFTPGVGIAQKLSLRLEEKGYSVITVVAGQGYGTVDHRTYSICPAVRADYDALFSALKEQGKLPKTIVHLWNVGHKHSLEQELELALYSPLHLLQAAAEDPEIGPVECMIVSTGLHEITGYESLSPAKATLLGLCRTVPRDLPGFICRSVDIELPPDGSPIERSLVDQLVAEIESKEQQLVISYRGARRWSQTFEQAQLLADGPDLIEEGGVYLITGGLHSPGFQFAEWLASVFRAAVVLVDDLSFPSREQWDTWVETHPGDPAVDRINRIRRWEQNGAKILVSSADITDRNQTRELCEHVREFLGTIRGVIHTANSADNGPITSRTRSTVAATLEPKIQGVLVLNEVLREDDLDFMVFCSSLNSVVGTAEQVQEAAANAFLDSFAQAEFFRSRCFMLSINWDRWEESNTGISLAVQSTSGAIRADEGTEVLRRLLLAKPGPQAIISTRDLSLLSRLKQADSADPAAEESERVYERPNLDRPIELPTNAMETLLVRIWTEVLGVSPIGINDDFFELGGDSLIGLKMTARTRDLGLNVSIEQLFQNPTVRELAASVQEGKQTPAASATLLREPGDKRSAIRRVDRTGKLPLSHGQERLWFINLLEPENVSYNMPDSVRIKGPLNVAALEATLREVVRRHESLRTRFVNVNGEPQQIIDPTVTLDLPVIDLSYLEPGKSEAEARRLALDEARQPFALAHGPLFRIKLLRLDSQDHVLVFNMHHIVTDQWSVGVLVQEVSAIYKNFSAGLPSPLPELDIQYADFSAWQRELLSGPLLEEQLSYWKQKLAGVEPLALPTDSPRTAMQRQNGAKIGLTIPLELTDTLKTVSRKQGATLYMILLAAFQALLGRYSRQYDIALGSPIAGRSRTETEALIGFFVNTLVLRTDLSGNPDLTGLLRQVKATTLEAYAHQDVPFEKLVEILLPQRDLTRTPLFQVVFVLQNVPWTALDLGAAQMLPFEVETGSTQFEISMVLAENASGIEGFIEYQTDLFEEATISRMAAHFKRLLSGMTVAPHAPLDEIDILSVQEKQTLLEQPYTLNENIVPVTLTELFEAQVQKTPDATALVFGEQSLSYTELNEHANRLAHLLIECGASGRMVGIALQRSLEMVVTIVATLKAGAGYLPLDPDYPEARLAYMVADAAPVVVVTTTALRDHLPQDRKLVCLDAAETRQALDRMTTCNPAAFLLPMHPAYVIYTSGSTGAPKGVVVTHENVTRLFAATARWFCFGPQDVWTLFHSYAFDFSVWEIWGALLFGGRLVVVSKAVSRSPAEFLRLLTEQGVTVLNQTPSAFYQLMQADEELPEISRCLKLQTVVFGGEALELRRLQGWYERHREDAPRLVNMYGITETTVHVSYLPMTAELAAGAAGSLIGGNIPDLQVYVLDEKMQPVPVGVFGEMYVGGAGLAQGYLNRPDLTAERFVPDVLSGRDGERLYRTGDVARWRSDHTLEYQGRADQQVKIRGFRIELGEIEAALEQHELVRQAVVIAQKEEKGDQRLVAYVVPKAVSEGNGNAGPKAELQSSELREHLRTRLPEYMVPSAYIQLATLPLNQNGKIDRKNLPGAQGVTLQSSKNGVAPRTDIEHYLAEVWQEFLDIDKVGVEHNFFDLGGHSLMIVQIHARLVGRFGDRLKVVDFFTYPTIAGLAGYLEQQHQDDKTPEEAAMQRADRQLQAFAVARGGRHEAE